MSFTQPEEAQMNRDRFPSTAIALLALVATAVGGTLALAADTESPALRRAC